MLHQPCPLQLRGGGPAPQCRHVCAQEGGRVGVWECWGVLKKGGSILEEHSVVNVKEKHAVCFVHTMFCISPPPHQSSHTELVSTPGGMMQQPMVNMPMEPQSSATLTAPTMSGTIPPPPPINAPSPMLVVDGVGSYVPFTMYSQQLPQHLQGGMGSGGNMPPYGCAPTPGGVSSPMMPVSGALVGGMVPL